MRELRKELKEEDLKLVIIMESESGDYKEICYKWDSMESLRDNEERFWELTGWKELSKDDLIDLIDIWNEYLDSILTPNLIVP